MVGLLILTLTWALCELYAPGSAGPGGVTEAWIVPAIMGGISIAQMLLNRKKGNDSGVPGEAQFQAQASQDATTGAGAEADYLSYLKGFDASKAAETTAGALSQDWRKTFGRDIESLRGGQVSRGRLDTGYGMEDEDRYVTDFQDNVAKQLAALSMQATGMNLGAKSQLGAYGERVTGRGLDLTATRRDQYLMDRASKRAMYGGIGSALLGAAGTAYGAYKGAQGG